MLCTCVYTRACLFLSVSVFVASPHGLSTGWWNGRRSQFVLADTLFDLFVVDQRRASQEQEASPRFRVLYLVRLRQRWAVGLHVVGIDRLFYIARLISDGFSVLYE
jgi:hypothetical protein